MRHRCSPSRYFIIFGLLVDYGASGFVAPFSKLPVTTNTPPSASFAISAAFEQRRKLKSGRRSTASSLTNNGVNSSSKTTHVTAANSSPDLVLDLLSSTGRSNTDASPSAEPSVAVEAGTRTASASAAGESPPYEEEAQEEDGRGMEDFQAMEMISKGAGVVGAGVKKVARASRPLKREPDGRMVMDANGLLNLSIIVCSGLWIMHSIATVDATSWRGWTLQETLMRLPWDNWESYEVGLVEHPIITKTAINTGIYVIGDWMSQVNWGKEEDVELWEFDLMRTFRSGLIGAFFGPVAHFYYNFSDWILPPDVLTNRPFKIMMDQSIYFCSKCTVYMSLVCLLRGASLKETKETLDERLTGVITTGWRFWPFVHVLTYFLIPPRHRVLWVNSVDLLWNSILSGMTSGQKANEDEAVAADGEDEESKFAYGTAATAADGPSKE